MCEKESTTRKLRSEAFGLRRSGNYRKAKEKYLQAFKQLQGTSTVDAAEALFDAGDCAYKSEEYDEAAGYFRTAADLSDSRRDFQSAVMALERLLGCKTVSQKTEELKQVADELAAVKEKMPHDLEECFAELERQLTPKQLENFKNMKGGDIGMCHFGLGLWIRNSWGLWHGSDLAKHFQNMGIAHPDDMSCIILYRFHQHLNSKRDEVVQPR